MTTVTKPAPARMSFLGGRIEDVSQRFQELDQFLFETFDADEGISSDLILAANSVGMDKTQVEREFGRAESVRRHQKIAGSQSEREADTKCMQSAQERLAKRTPEIAEAIERLKRELAELQTKKAEAEQKVFRREQSVEALKSDNHLPKYVNVQICALQTSYGPLRKETIETRQRVNLSEQILAVDHESELAVNHCRGRDKRHMLKPGWADKVSESAWADYQNELRATLDEDRQKAERLERQLREAEKSIDELRDHYLPQ